ncbi:hypothetical protein LTS08_005429 [Lithohypha guttulata]|uniref:uncharacterized protein n=1 Tax=Lithohypha guttulata TaxID=1690604 RepID=UPI002DDF331E|nr:hypothetical protein LTR51_003392 [Lithohypha guttulata]KAK5099714.1 hypothetical protein LTS08_005429 [Lithohypha guttulata]
MKTLIALALFAAYTTAVPPASFGFPQSEGNTPLSVVYQANGSALPVQPGNLFGINVPAEAPSIAVNESYQSLGSAYTGQYVFFMLDPDASYPENPQNRWVIHWWQQGLTKSTSQVNDSGIGGTLLQNNTQPRVAYRRPRPPTNSSAHRYIQYLFEQPPNFSIPAIYSGYNNTNASRFPFEQFVADAGLNQPVAANYFYCSNQTAVPATFVAAPGGQYPGGNGAMITQGTNLPSATSTMVGPTSATSPAVYTGSAASVEPGSYVAHFLLAFGASWAFIM